MKQDLTNSASTESTNECKEVTFVKRASYVLGAGALAIFAVCAVGVYAMTGGSRLSKNTEAQAYGTVTTTAIVRAEGADSSAADDDSVSQVAMTLKKAGIDEYDLVVETMMSAGKNISAKNSDANAKTVKTTTSKKTTVSETAKTASDKDIGDLLTTTDARTESAEPEAAPEGNSSNASSQQDAQTDDIRTCGAMTMFTIEGVNLRQDASLNADVLRVLPASFEVTVTGYNDDWYRIKADGQTGYCLKRYLSSERAVQPSDASVISYSETEFDMLCAVLQGEVGDCSEASKIAVANVIINRVKSPLFPNTISEVLNQENQFTAVYGYYSGLVVPSQNTMDCARRALSGEDNTYGAIYYYAPQYCSGSAAAWFETLTFCMEIDGQRYFK